MKRGVPSPHPLLLLLLLETPATQAMAKLNLVLQNMKMNISLLHDFGEEIDSSLII